MVYLSVTADVHQEGAATGDSVGDLAEPGTLKQDVSKVGAFCCQLCTDYVKISLHIW